MAALEIVGAAEAAEILDIGNTNFSHLRKQRADTDDAFPEPMVVLKCGPIWKKSDVNKYAKTFTKGRRGPKPQTPVKKTAAKKVPVSKSKVVKKKLSLAKG